MFNSCVACCLRHYVTVMIRLHCLCFNAVLREAAARYCVAIVSTTQRIYRKLT